MKGIFTAFLLTILLCIPILSYAQTLSTAQDEDETDVIKINTEAVYFDLSVRDKLGKPLVELNAAEFSLYEDGQSQQISHFTKVNTPIHLVMIIDASSSIKPHKAIVQQAAYEFMSKLNIEDQIAIVQFKARPMILANFSSDHEKLKKALGLLGESVIEVDDVESTSGEGSAIYDSLALATKLLAKTTGRKAVLLFSDWMDNSSYSSFELVKSRLEDSGASLYLMKLENEEESEALVRQGGGFSTKQFQKYLKNYLCKDCIKKGDKDITYNCSNCLDSMNKMPVEKLCEVNQALYKLAQQEINSLIGQIGGRVFPVKTITDLTDQYNALLEEMHTIYSVGYYPEHTESESKKHSLELKTKLPNVVLSYRKSY